MFINHNPRGFSANVLNASPYLTHGLRAEEPALRNTAGVLAVGESSAILLHPPLCL